MRLPRQQQKPNQIAEHIHQHDDFCRSPNRASTQWPKAGGRSRHGEPVRTRYKTVCRNRRLSFTVAPASLSLPGRCDPNRYNKTSNTTTAARSFKPPFWKFEPDIKPNENPECPRALVCLPFVCCQLYLTGYQPPDDQGRDVFQFICITRYDHSKIMDFYRCNPVMLKIGFCFGADRLFTFPQTQA